MKSNTNSFKPSEFGLDYFKLESFSSKPKNLLLKPIKFQCNESVKNTLNLNNAKKKLNFIDSLVDDLKFSYDVVAERCAHLLPYDEKIYESVYNCKDVLSSKKKPIRSSYKISGVPNKHICHKDTKNISHPMLFSVDKLNAYSENIDRKKIEEIVEIDNLSNIPEKPKKYWDEYMLSLLSKNTAQYLAYEMTSDEEQGNRLKKLVDNWYGPPSSFRELIPDQSVDTEELQSMDLKSTFPYKYYMDVVASRNKPMVIAQPGYQSQSSTRTNIRHLLNKETNIHEENDQTDPYGNETKASFYRLPVLVRRTKKQTQEIDIVSINRTTKTLNEFQIPETPRKVVNQKIGDKVLRTENPFEQDLFIYENKHQTKLLHSSDSLICVDDKIYRKVLQPIWPNTSVSDHPLEIQLNLGPVKTERVIKGHNRWIGLPIEEQINSLGNCASDIESKDKQLSRKRARENSSLNLLVDEWRKKWHLSQKFADSSTDELLKDMLDVHPTIRMQAIVTAAKAATVLHNQRNDQFDSGKGTISSEVLPQVLVNAIEILLDDPHFQVRKAAAIALHSLEKSSEKSLEILQTLLLSKSNIDRWSAVQCLALSNKCDSNVISELIDQLMNSEDIIVHEKASYLLAKISYHTKLAHGMLGERLNTISWRQRVIICKTIPLLHGSLNRDLLKKIIYIMWNDPHKQVRIAASQALGRTGNGKAVHDELILKLQNESELIRADALEKIGILKVMTARIMPMFLNCFKDEFVIVRKEVCIACCRLKIDDKIVVNHLLELARYDPLWKVKFYAIHALSKIKTPNPEIQSCFLWAVQYESLVKLRLEALKAISSFPAFDKEIIEIVKSRFLVEDNKEILKILKEILIHVNINPKSDINTISEIKSEVRRFLSNKDHIVDTILNNEAIENYKILKDKMVAASSTSETNNESSDETEPLEESSGDEIDIVSRINSSKFEERSFSNNQCEPIEVTVNAIDIGDNTIIITSGEESVKEQISTTDTDEKKSQNSVDTGNSFVQDESILGISELNTIEMETDLSKEKDINFEADRQDFIVNKQEEFERNDDENIIKNDEVKTEMKEDISIENTFNIECSSLSDKIEQTVGENFCTGTPEKVEEIEKFEKVTNTEDQRQELVIDPRIIETNESNEIIDEFLKECSDSKITNENVEIIQYLSVTEDNQPKSKDLNHLVCWNFRLPKDSSHIKIFYPESSVLSSHDSIEYKLDNNLWESVMDQSILDQVNEAIEENGIDFGPSLEI